MMITMGVSTQLFNAPITPQLVLAVILVATSTFQYNLPESCLDDDTSLERKGLMSPDALDERIEGGRTASEER